METIKFNSKHNIYNTILIALAFIICGALCFAVFYWFNNITYGIIISILLGAFLLVINLFYFNCYYIIENDKLIVNIGFIKFDLLVTDIIEIKKVKNLKFSFATAFEKIELRFGSENKRWSKIYVSPKNEDEFIAKIKSLTNI